MRPSSPPAWSSRSWLKDSPARARDDIIDRFSALPFLAPDRTSYSPRAAFLLVLDELYPWLASLERLQPALKGAATAKRVSTVGIG